MGIGICGFWFVCLAQIKKGGEGSLGGLLVGVGFGFFFCLGFFLGGGVVVGLFSVFLVVWFCFFLED